MKQAIIIFVIALVALGAGIGFRYYQNSRTSNQAVVETSVPSTQTQPQENITIPTVEIPKIKEFPQPYIDVKKYTNPESAFMAELMNVILEKLKSQ